MNDPSSVVLIYAAFGVIGCLALILLALFRE